MENAVWIVQRFTLENNIRFKNGRQSWQVVENYAWIAVVWTAVEPIIYAHKALLVLIFALELCLPFSRS